MKKITLIIGLIITLALAGCNSLPNDNPIADNSNGLNIDKEPNLLKIENLIEFKGEKRDWISAINVSVNNADIIKSKKIEGYYLQDNMSRTNGFRVFDKNGNELGSISIFNNAKWEDELINILKDNKLIENNPIGLPNPASLYCEDNDGKLEIRKDEDGGEYGVCIFEDGTECEEWAYYKGECLKLTLDQPLIEMCNDMCGDGLCQEIVCQGEGCPCAESTVICPVDCTLDKENNLSEDELVRCPDRTDNNCPDGTVCYSYRSFDGENVGPEIGDLKCHKICSSDKDCAKPRSCKKVWVGMDLIYDYQLCI